MQPVLLRFTGTCAFRWSRLEEGDSAEVCGILAAPWAQRMQQSSRAGIQLGWLPGKASCLQPALSTLFLCAGVPTLSGFAVLL